jgi:hypothetical protein
MISNDSGKDSPAQPQAQNPETTAGSAVKALDPNKPIEVASTGTGTMNDPAGSDNRPPRACDLELLA